MARKSSKPELVPLERKGITKLEKGKEEEAKREEKEKEKERKLRNQMTLEKDWPGKAQNPKRFL